MLGKAKICTNIEEIQKCEQLNLKDKPEPQFMDTAFLFRVEHVVFAYVNLNNKIVILIYGREVMMEYTDELWSKLETLIGI